ncbi:MAG: sulfotransferase [Bacteroidota bacterium]
MYSNKIPSFLVVGAAKSGTTSLHHYLNAHPDLFLPEIKETWFFSTYNNPNQSIKKYFPKFEFPSSWEDYLGVFSTASSSQMCGEITPSYLFYHELVVENIKRFYPSWEDLKIIIILREPIAKVLSHFRYVQKAKLDPEDLDLWTALQREEERSSDPNLIYDLLYVANTSYYQQVKTYLENFPQCQVVLFEELRDQPRELLDKLATFIGVDSINWPTEKVHNVSKHKRGVPNGPVAAWLLKHKRQISQFVPSSLRGKLGAQLWKEDKLDPRAISFLQKVFKEEVIQLEDLIQQDLSHWLAKY